MFTIHHRETWQGEALVVELERAPTTDWLGLSVSAALLVLLLSGCGGPVDTATFDPLERRVAIELHLAQQRGDRASLPVAARLCASAVGETRGLDRWATPCAEVLEPWVGDPQPAALAGGSVKTPWNHTPGSAVMKVSSLNGRGPLGGPAPWRLGVLGLIIGWNVFRRARTQRPLRMVVRPGRWEVDGQVLGHVTGVRWIGGRLVLTLPDRIWRSPKLLPVGQDTVDRMHQALTGSALLGEEQAAGEALAPLSGARRR